MEFFGEEFRCGTYGKMLVKVIGKLHVETLSISSGVSM
jgi:hypothetical protein